MREHGVEVPGGPGAAGSVLKSEGNLIEWQLGNEVGEVGEGQDGKDVAWPGIGTCSQNR